MRIRKYTVTAAITAAALMSACSSTPAREDRRESASEVQQESLEVRETDAEDDTLSAEEVTQEPLKISCLTTDRVLELSQKEGLSWSDLKDYDSVDTGSGLMILQYDVDRDFSLAAGGTGYDRDPEYIRLVSRKDENTYIDIRDSSGEEVKKFLEEYSCRKEYVALKGHIKEIRGDRALISSDTDDFPGVFWALGISEAAVYDELKGGIAVYALLEDMGKEGADGISEYRAVEIFEMSEEERAQEEVSLTSAPAISFGDLLSSTISCFQVQPANFSWNTSDGTAVAACGAGPLDEEAVKSAARLKIPRYNGTERVMYSCSMTIFPDKLVVRQWDKADAGNGEAEEESLTVCCAMPGFWRLERGKIYEFSAQWKEEHMEDRGFWGDASYVFVTE